jgi:hypothetical protein
MQFNKTKRYNKAKRYKKQKKTKKYNKSRKYNKAKKYGGNNNYFEQIQQNQINTVTRKMIGFMSKFAPPVMNYKAVIRNGNEPINTP